MTRIGTTVKAEGMRELRKKLRRMDNGMDNLKGLHLDLAEIVANRAEALAPVRTGRLKQSIRPSGTQTAGRVRAGYKRVPWTGPVHFGWATRPDAAKGWRGGPTLTRFCTTPSTNATTKYLTHILKVLKKYSEKRASKWRKKPASLT